MKTFLVFLKSCYVRDAQGFFPDKWPNMYEFEDDWKDVGGPMLLMKCYGGDLAEVWEAINRVYPNTAREVFEIYETAEFKAI